MNEKESTFESKTGKIISKLGVRKVIAAALEIKNHIMDDGEKKVIKAATVTALTAIALTGCATARGEAQPTTQATHSTSEVEPSSTPSPEQSNTTEGVTPSTYEYKQTISISEMQSMSQSDFENLDYANRAAFLISEVPQGVSVSSSIDGDAQSLSQPGYIPEGFWQQADTAIYGEANKDTAVKEYLGLNYYPETLSGETTSNTQDVISDIEANGGAGVGVNTVYDYKSSGKLQNGIDEYGKKVQWIDITYEPFDNSTQKDSGPEVTIQAIRTPIKLLDGTTQIIYGQGLATAGKASPKTGYSY